MQKISTFLWFDHDAEEAVALYVSLFAHSRITNITRYSEGSRGTPGSVMTMAFELEGREFLALNGGPVYSFTPAISLFVNCESQEEVDRLWNTLSAGGEEMQCGWLRDKFGVTWQIVPAALGRLLSHPDPATAQRVLQAMFTMKKIDIAALERARDAVRG